MTTRTETAGPRFPEEHGRYYDGIEWTQLENGGYFLTEKRSMWGSATHERNMHWLMTEDSTAVAFCEMLFHPTHDAHRLTLCDLEVRESHRGTGLARTLVAAVEAHYGETVYTTGAFTPEGAAGLSFLPLLPGHEAEVRFRSMKFVKDWDSLIIN